MWILIIILIGNVGLGGLDSPAVAMQEFSNLERCKEALVAISSDETIRQFIATNQSNFPNNNRFSGFCVKNY
jgi:hypothetical protein